jgi:hypothetical protein
MQLFVRGQRTVALDTADAATVADVKATYAARALQPGAADMLVSGLDVRAQHGAGSSAAAGATRGSRDGAPACHTACAPHTPPPLRRMRTVCMLLPPLLR